MSQKVYNAVYYKRKRLSNRCVRCRGPRDSRKAHCRACLDYFKARPRPPLGVVQREKRRDWERKDAALKRARARVRALDKLVAAS